MKPVGHHILVEMIPFEQKSKGGIVIASQTQIKREEQGRDIAKIVSFGPLAYVGFEGCNGPAEWGVKEGDYVQLKARYCGTAPRIAETKEEYKHYKIINDNDVIAVLDEAEVANG